MSLDVRYAQLADHPRLSAFLATYWAKDHVYVRQRSLFEWTLAGASSGRTPATRSRSLFETP